MSLSVKVIPEITQRCQCVCKSVGFSEIPEKLTSKGLCVPGFNRGEPRIVLNHFPPGHPDAKRAMSLAEVVLQLNRHELWRFVTVRLTQGKDLDCYQDIPWYLMDFALLMD